MQLKDKTVLITGASDGIGREASLNLAKEKMNLILLARNEERLNAVKAEAEKLGSPKVNIYLCDLSIKQEIKDAVGTILQEHSNIDILINNAGIWQKEGQLDGLALDEIEAIINTNLTGLILLTNLLLPTIRKSQEAAILNISSRSGYNPKGGQSVYQASKWGVRGFTEVLKLDLKETNIRVAGLYQGKTNTGLFKKAQDEIDASFGTDPKDLADVVVFMLSRPPKIWLHDVRIEY
jgi:short-subunit dehydrogenase